MVIGRSGRRPFPLAIPLLILIAITQCCCCAAYGLEYRSDETVLEDGQTFGEIKRFPGWPAHKTLPNRMFSGFVPVGDDEDDTRSRRRLFWLLVLCDGCGDGPAAPDEDSDASSSSTAEQKKTPLLLWLTGGPGCSSLDAFLYEHGPFVASVQGGGKGGRVRSPASVALAKNPHAWSRRASVLYVDSPAGSGFSYSPGAEAYDTDDRRTVRDLVAFVGAAFGEGGVFGGGGGDSGVATAPAPAEAQLLLRLIGQRSPLYVAGESYAGVIVPMLVDALVDRMTTSSKRTGGEEEEEAGASSGGGVRSSSRSNDSFPTLKLRGYILGNAVTDDAYDGNAKPPFAWGMNLLDPPTWRALQRHCACDDGAPPASCYWNATGACRDALGDMSRSLEGINPYSILDDCTSEPPAAEEEEGGGGGGGGGGGATAASRRLRRRLSVLPPPPTAASSISSPPHHSVAQRLNHAVACSDRRAARLLFRSAEGRSALGVPPGAPEWEPCADSALRYRFVPLVGGGSIVRVHQRLMGVEGGGGNGGGERGGGGRPLRALVLSGDHDLVVPVTGTRAWVYGEMAPMMRPLRRWSAWRYSSSSSSAEQGGGKEGEQVGGFAAVFSSGGNGGGGGGGEFTFATIKGGGHMAAQTKPLQTLRLLEKWLDGEL